MSGQGKHTGKAVIFSAPSGAGKTTLVRHLLENTDLALGFSISATTRKPRGKERDGEDYHFLSEEAFEDALAAGEFVEWEEVYTGVRYGTLKRELNRVWGEGKAVLFDVDVVGGVNLRKILGMEIARSVFVMPPSIAVLRERLETRKTDSPSKIEQRVSKAEAELKFADAFDYQLVNDRLDEAKREVESLVRAWLSVPSSEMTENG
jgi:guanylate kinase